MPKKYVVSVCLALALTVLPLTNCFAGTASGRTEAGAGDRAANADLSRRVFGKGEAATLSSEVVDTAAGRAADNLAAGSKPSASAPLTPQRLGNNQAKAMLRDPRVKTLLVRANAKAIKRILGSNAKFKAVPLQDAAGVTWACVSRCLVDTGVIDPALAVACAAACESGVGAPLCLVCIGVAAGALVYCTWNCWGVMY